MLYTILFLVIYGIGILIGKFFNIKKASLLMNIVVYILIAFLSLWAGKELTSSNVIVQILLSSLFYSLIIIAITYMMGLIIPLKSYKNHKIVNFDYKLTNLTYIIILAIGWIIGYFVRVEIDYSSVVEYLLYALAFFAGLSIGNFLSFKLIKNNLSLGLMSIIVVILGALISSTLLYISGIKPYSLSLSICFGSGWYTYTGSIIASYYGSYYGTLGFLINFFREQLTFVLVPILSRIYANPVSIISIGGATSMDTTLGLYSLVLGPKDSMGALISGVLLTFIIPIIIPATILLVPI